MVLETITVNTAEGNSVIYTGADWRMVAGIIPRSGVIIITDDNVRSIYGGSFPRYPVISIAPGEKSKSLETIGAVVEQMLQEGIDRNGFVLGIGGGVVCDIAGFIASVYMRGVRFGFVSTTLLSQVDASTGGKNGVNSRNAKNIIGVFNNPEFVICDPEMLKTLPEDEYRSGLAELIKTALIKDPELLWQIESSVDAIGDRNSALMACLIYRAVSIKASVVENDMRESGERRLLNFGHTLGHSAELEYGLPHGKAVAWGMLLAMKLSVERGYLATDDFKRISELFSRAGIMPEVHIDGEVIAGRLIYDKKRTGDEINFILIDRPGRAFPEKVSLDELTEFLMNKRTI